MMPPHWEKNILGRLHSFCALALVGAAFAQGPEVLGRAYRESPTPARRKALERFAASHGGATSDLAHLALGVALVEQKQYADAIKNLEAARAGLPKLADYVALYLASARLGNASGDPAAAVRDAEAVRSQPLESPLAAKSIVLEARAQTASGAPQEAIHLLRDRSGDLPQPEGDLALAAAYETAHQWAPAVEYYQRIFYRYPASEQAIEAAAALVNLRGSLKAAFPQPPAELMLERPQQLLAGKEYIRARSEFRSLVTELSGEAREQARIGVGAADFLEGRVARAYQYLRQLEITDGEAGAERWYYLVECAIALHDDDQIQEALKQLNRRHAESAWRFRALVAAANHFLLANQHEKYVPLYKAAYEDFPNQPGAAACHWKVTWDTYLRRKHEAGGLLREHLERYAKHSSASTALYFLGRWAASHKDNAAARAYYGRLEARFPNYYYGVLARERLSEPQVAGAGVSAEAQEFLERIAFPPRPPAIAGQPDAETVLRMARARLLRSAGLTDLADAELRFGVRHGSQPYLLALDLGRSGSTYERLHNVKSAAPDYLCLNLEDAPREFWQVLFPLPYQNDLLRAARQRNLDPYMVAGLIRQESEFNPQALSAAKAYGLTQVRPATGRSLGRRAGVGRVSNRRLFQPSINLKLGAYYLRMLLDDYGGKWEAALAAYNAGKARADEWLSWYNYQEPAEFVESIPFTETREYVEAVLRNAAVYRQIYGDPLQSKQRGGGVGTETKIDQEF